MAATPAEAARSVPAEESRTEYPHIVRTPGVVGGRPRVAGTRIPVWQLAGLWNLGDTATDLLAAYPRLTPAALHSALAYYFDHQSEIDAEIDANRPERVLAELRRDPALVEERPGTFGGRAPAYRAAG